MAGARLDGFVPFACCGRLDLGVVECTLQPVPFRDDSGSSALQAAILPGGVRRSDQSGFCDAAFLPGLVDPLGCQDPLASQLGGRQRLPTCCTVEESQAETRRRLFKPCLICAVRAASVVEVPCGHVTVCMECYGDYETNTKCLVCSTEVSARVDVGPFLDSFGRPALCHVCRNCVACVVTVPCVHMSLCTRCLPMKPRGCPTCGETVEQSCAVRWPPDAAACPSSLPHRGGRAGSDVGSLRSRRGPRSGTETATPRTAGSMSVSGECLVKATQDVEQDILRLERQLLCLRTLSHSTSPTGAAGSLKDGGTHSRTSSSIRA